MPGGPTATILSTLKIKCDITGQGQAGAQGFYGGGEDGGVKDGGEENGVKEEF